MSRYPHHVLCRRPEPGPGRMSPEVRVLPSLLGLALLWFPLDSHARAREYRRWLGGQ